MAYTIIRSSGQVITIQDGTLNTTNTSLTLPGRNYAGYGQAIDTNFVRLLENFASSTPPANPIKGQLWYNTTLNTLQICPSDGNTTASAWPSLATTSAVGTTTLSDLNAGNITLPAGNIILQNGKVDVTGNIYGSNLFITSNAAVDVINTRVINTSGSGNGINTRAISAGSATTTGTLTGVWTVVGNNSSGGNAIVVSQGDIAFPSGSTGIKCDTYMYANGTPISFSGTYTNGNVSDYLTGSNSVAQFSGNIAPTKVTTGTLAGGGNIEGIWTLATNARIEATYADVAERYEADAVYAVGTVVEIGGTKEVTVASELSNNVFGVVSDSYAYLLNESAGTDETHPAIALVGRVKVNVVGQINKGDRLVSAGNGIARAAKIEELTGFNSIGRSLVNKADDGLGQVEATVVIK